MNCRYKDQLDRFLAALDEENEDAISKCVEECSSLFPTLCLNDVDHLINTMLNELYMKLNLSSANYAFDLLKIRLNNYALLIRYFNALFPPDASKHDYAEAYYNIVDNMASSDCISYCNALLVEYGMCAIPDIMLLSKLNQSKKLYEVVWRQLNTIRDVTECEIKMPQCDKICESILDGYLKEALVAYDNKVPLFLVEAKTPHLDVLVESDMKMLMEKYENDVLEQKLEKYHEKYIDDAGMYHIMANLFQEGAICMDSYMWCQDMFESWDERCEREHNYLMMCEASYRATGKRPRYISNTYDLDDPKDQKKEKNDEWINPPKDDGPELPDTKPTKKPPVEDDDDETIEPVKKRSSTPTTGNVYNITYQNSFNRNRKKSINDSFNNSRLNSDDNYGSDDEDYSSSKYSKSKRRTMADWLDRRKIQKKLQETYSKKHALEDSPSDVKPAYLKLIMWNSENTEDAAPWIVMRDTHQNRPHQDIEYRKYLVGKMKELADDRDIEYDGEIIVAGDPTDGIYNIELSRYNEQHVVDAIRRVANAVIKKEIQHIQHPDTGNKTLNEALETFKMLDEFEEAIAGGDPTKDRPLTQRINNKIEDFNVKSQKAIAGVDKELRQTGGIVSNLTRTPVQLVNVVKNFISDMNNRKEQNTKELILKDKKTRLTIYGFMRSLIKTAIPWVVAGPLWGTLINMIAIPVRAVKGGITALRGGPYRDITVEIRDEMRVELSIIDDMIQKAEAAGNSKEKYRLMRERSRMEQEFLKIASKIHWEPKNAIMRNRSQAPQ